MVTEWQKARAYDAVHPLVDIPDAQKAERVDRKMSQQRRIEAGAPAHGGNARRRPATTGGFVVPDVPWLERKVQGGYTPPPIVDAPHGAAHAAQDASVDGGA